MNPQLSVLSVVNSGVDVCEDIVFVLVDGF